MAPRTLTAVGPLGVVHVHSAYSHDGRDSLPSLREWAAARGIGFIGLTDHAEDFDPAIFARFVAECERNSDDEVRLVPGLEFRFAGYKGMHLLALGLTSWIAPERPEEFVPLARGAGAFTIVAHPVLPRYRIPPAVLEGIDAIEVWNAAYNTRFLPDPRAMRILRRLRRRRPHVVATAGLDQHDASNDRGIRILLPEAVADPIGALRAGRYTNIGPTMRFDAAANLGLLRGAALAVIRPAYDLVERTQDYVTRWLR